MLRLQVVVLLRAVVVLVLGSMMAMRVVVGPKCVGGGAAEGVGVSLSPEAQVAGGCWRRVADELEVVMAEGALGVGVQWEDIVVELDAMPCEWELGSRSVGPAAEWG